MVEQLHLVVERGHVDQQYSDCGSETEHHVSAIFLADRPGAFQLVELCFEKRACHVLRCLSIHVGKCKRRRSVRATQSCESVEKWINNPPKPAMWISACAVCGICRGCAETVLCSRACVCGGVPETECACAAVHVRDTCARAVCTACACEMCVCGVRASCRMPVICRACIIGGRQMCVRVYGGFHSGQHRSDGSVRVPRVYGRLCRRGQSAWTFTASRVCVRACRASCAGYLRVDTSA